MLARLFLKSAVGQSKLSQAELLFANLKRNRLNSAYMIVVLALLQEELNRREILNSDHQALIKSIFTSNCQKLNLNKLAKNEKLIYHGPFFTLQEVSVWTKSTCRTQLSDFVAQWREGISSQKYFGSRINSF